MPGAAPPPGACSCLTAPRPQASPFILHLQPYHPSLGWGWNDLCRLLAGEKKTKDTSQHPGNSSALVTIVPFKPPIPMCWQDQVPSGVAWEQPGRERPVAGSSGAGRPSGKERDPVVSPYTEEGSWNPHCLQREEKAPFPWGALWMNTHFEAETWVQVLAMPPIRWVPGSRWQLLWAGDPTYRV